MFMSMERSVERVRQKIIYLSIYQSEWQKLNKLTGAAIERNADFTWELAINNTAPTAAVI